MAYKHPLFRTKSAERSAEESNSSGLNQCLTALDLTLMGIGAIIGAGIFVLTGIAAATQSGPAIIISFLLAGIACAFSALSYAELSSSIGGCGSAYSYAYASLGEFFAWIIGWDLLLEYGLASSAVAIGWAGYTKDMLQSMGLTLPEYLTKGPFEHGIVNLPALLIILVIMLFLSVGVKQSARFNSFMVALKLAIVGLFIVVAADHVNPANWHPFLPFGWHGVVSGAALIFFAYIGFDAVSTAAEEAINPKRDLPIGIMASLLVCTIVYMLVAGLLTGIAPYTSLNVSSPVAHALLLINLHFVAAIIAVGAVAGLTTVILVMYYGLTRIFLAMSRDGLLPAHFARVHPKTKTPLKIIWLVGIVMALIAGFVPINRVAELVNIGTLAAFMVVCIGTIILRHTHPDLERPFKTPFSPLVPGIGALLCVFLMLHLARITWINFLIWSAIGLVIYFAYGRYSSVLQRQTNLDNNKL